MGLTEKAAYLKGLIEGLGVDDSTKEGKIILAMNELIGEMATAIRELDEDMSQVYDEVDAICDEIEDMEANIYGDESEEADTEEARYEVDCPLCGETVSVSEADLEAGEAVCCACGQSFGIELEAMDEEPEEELKYEITCPLCGAATAFSEEELASACCSGCGAPLEIEMESEEAEETEEDEADRTELQ